MLCLLLIGPPLGEKSEICCNESREGSLILNSPFAKPTRFWDFDYLGDLADARGFVVINDEAHHAWRKPANGELARA